MPDYRRTDVSYTDSFNAFAVKDVPLIEPGDDVAQIIIDSIEKMGKTIKENDIFIIASKIVSKADPNCYVDLRTIVPSERALALAKLLDPRRDARHIELTLQQGKLLGWSFTGLLIELENGMILPHAGLDRDNIKNTDASDITIKLPEDPDKSAKEIRVKLEEHYKVKLGVILNDTMIRSWRNGGMGMSIGSSGVKVLDEIHKDQFRNMCLETGRPLGFRNVMNIGDQLAGIGTLLMGETIEGIPLVVIQGFNLSNNTQDSRLLSHTRKNLMDIHEIQQYEYQPNGTDKVYYFKPK